MKFKQRSCGLVNVANFEGAKVAVLDNTKWTFGFVEKHLNATEGTVALLLNAGSNDIIDTKGGGGASSIYPFTMCSAALIEQK